MIKQGRTPLTPGGGLRLSKDLSPLIRRRQTEIVSAGFPGGVGRFRHLPKPFLTFFAAVSISVSDELCSLMADMLTAKNARPQFKKVAAATFLTH